jgi:hypothetical protein
MLMLINPSAAFMKIFISVMTVTTGVSIIVASITIGVIIAKGPFSEIKVVLQSPTTIALNRFIQPYELPLFDDAVTTMNIFLADVINVLRGKFGNNFVSGQMVSFSATPSVTSTQTKEFTLTKGSVNGDTPGSTDSITTTTTSTTSQTIDYTTTTFDSCTDALITMKNDTDEQNISDCVNMTVPFQNCTNTTDVHDMIECLNIMKLVFSCQVNSSLTFSNVTVSVEDCSYITNHTIDCNNITIEFPDCFNQSTSAQNTSAWSTTTPAILSSTSIDNTTQCNISLNTNGQPSIILSTMVLFFAVTKGESISAEDIFNTLKNLQPSITLLTGCLQPSSQKSSFNASLSKVEPPVTSDLTLADLQNQPSISTSLQDQVRTDANTDEGQLINNLSTQPSVTPQVVG